MKYFNKTIIITLFIVSLLTPNIEFGQNSKLSRESVLSGLNHLNVGRIPDTLWTTIFDSAFDFIKSGDSLVFSKTVKFTIESKYLLHNYIAFYWENFLVNHTESFLSLAYNSSEYEIDWLANYAWLSSPTITKYESTKLRNNLKALELSPNERVSELASEYLRKYKIFIKNSRW